MSNQCCPSLVPTIRVDISPDGYSCVPQVPRELGAVGASTVQMFVYRATVGQTEFTGEDIYGNTPTFSDGETFINVNGVLLDPSLYSFSGSVVTLSDGCATDQDLVLVLQFIEPDVSELNLLLEDIEARLEALEAAS